MTANQPLISHLKLTPALINSRSATYRPSPSASHGRAVTYEKAVEPREPTKVERS